MPGILWFIAILFHNSKNIVIKIFLNGFFDRKAFLVNFQTYNLQDSFRVVLYALLAFC